MGVGLPLTTSTEAPRPALPVAVLCGGLGTRLADIAGDTQPKVLVQVAGRPFIDHKLENLAASGFREVVLLVGRHGDDVRDHVGDGHAFDLVVRYCDDGGVLRGTGGALRNALGKLPRAFWVTYGDTLLEIDAVGAEAEFTRSGHLGLMTVLHNRDRLATSNTAVDGELVVAYNKDPVPDGAEHIDYGMLVLTREAFDLVPASVPLDLAPILHALIERRLLGAWEVRRRFYEIGTPEARHETEQFLLMR